jgi:hypothetical protein
MDVRGWRKIASNREAWKLILEEGKVMWGQQNQWRRRGRRRRRRRTLFYED